MPHSVRNDLGGATPKRNAPGLRRRTSRLVSLLPTWTDIRILNMNRGLVNLQKDEKADDRVVRREQRPGGTEHSDSSRRMHNRVQWPLARP